jgi:hypothetical protein
MDKRLIEEIISALIERQVVALIELERLLALFFVLENRWLSGSSVTLEQNTTENQVEKKQHTRLVFFFFGVFQLPLLLPTSWSNCLTFTLSFSRPSGSRQATLILDAASLDSKI